MLNFSENHNDWLIIQKIGVRAKKGKESVFLIDYQTYMLHMDLEVCHCNGCKLNLEALLESSTRDFLHDISGIRANLNRRTGKLENCFSPRFSLNEITDQLPAKS